MSITANSYDNPKNNMNDNNNWKKDELSNNRDKLTSNINNNNNNDIEINNFDSNTSYSSSSSRSNSPPCSISSYNAKNMLKPNEYSRFKLKIDVNINNNDIDRDDNDVQNNLAQSQFKTVSKNMTNESNYDNNIEISSCINEKNQFENELPRAKERQKFQEDDSIIKNNNKMNKNDEILMKNESVAFVSAKKIDIENSNNIKNNKSETSSNYFNNYAKEINSNEKRENFVYKNNNNNSNILNKKDYDFNYNNNNVNYKENKYSNYDGAEYQQLNIIHENRKETATIKHHQSSSLSNSNEITTNHNNNKRNFNSEDPQQLSTANISTFGLNDANLNLNSTQLQFKNSSKNHDFNDALRKVKNIFSFSNA